MLSLTKRYHPITGEPLRREETYWEALPCDALRPYIRCFWGTLRPIPAGALQPTHEQGLVIPDTCMDIIFDVDYTGNSYAAAFCTLDEHSYRTGSSGAPASTTATFASQPPSSYSVNVRCFLRTSSLSIYSLAIVHHP